MLKMLASWDVAPYR